MPFYKPADDSAEMKYLQQRREQLGGYLPQRRTTAPKLELGELDETFAEFMQGSDSRALSTTMAFVRMLTKLLRSKEFGKLVVPIVPDEARTFGMEALFRQVGIYSANGQLYEPIDSDQLLYYKEARDGQIFEEGITEAGSMSTLIAAGTAYATHGLNMIPFFIYYSMFGFQRIGDLIWAAGDSRCRGFLLGGTAGWLVQRLCVAVPHHANCISRLSADRLVAEGYRGTPTVLPGLYAGPVEANVDDAVDPDLVVWAFAENLGTQRQQLAPPIVGGKPPPVR